MSSSPRGHLPGYLALDARGVLQKRADLAWERLRSCDLCPRHCGVDRLAGEQGFCRSGTVAVVASHSVHMWEEPPISGHGGSGTIFFSNCTGRCLFCQNYPISQLGVGRETSTELLARIMLRLQSRGCHNINLVTATHYVPQVVAALAIAAQAGLCIPIVYNTSGYESLSALSLLEGLIDIYLPDAKYADDHVATRLSGFPEYGRHNRSALIEMHRQMGDDLALDREGIARRGMIIRHLVLPGGLSQTPEVLDWIASHLSRNVHVSLMAQYFPAHQAVGRPTLGRALLPIEYEEALQAFERAGLERGWHQELDRPPEGPDGETSRTIRAATPEPIGEDCDWSGSPQGRRD